MQIRKTTRNWAVAGAVAAMLTASMAGVRAQDANGGMTSGSSTSGDMSAMSSTMSPNFAVLNNRTFDYVDLQQAKARGLSDDQIATIAKIARKTGMPFHSIAAAVQRGETFSSLASQYNLRLSDVYENDKEKQEISDYNSAYEAVKALGTGSDSAMNSGMTSSADTGGTATTPAPMADTTAASSNVATLDIVDTAMAAKNLTTLVQALNRAGLVETLKGAGPFTVFAPSDRAFAKLPAGQLDALLADPVKLKTILSYHVIPASIMAADASAMTSPTSPPTIQGGTLQVTKDARGRLKVNDATITKADIKASNGVIHIINQVLMPPMDATAPTAGATGTDTTTPPAAGTAPAAPAPAQ